MSWRAGAVGAVWAGGGVWVVGAGGGAVRTGWGGGACTGAGTDVVEGAGAGGGVRAGAA